MTIERPPCPTRDACPCRCSRPCRRHRREIDAARRNGPLREIVVPPCPELLTRLQQALASAEPEVHTLVAAGLVADYLLAHLAGLSPEPEWDRHGAAACEWLAISADDLHHWQDSFADDEALAPA